MKRLFKHEFYKLFNSKAFWIVLIIVALLSLSSAGVIIGISSLIGSLEGMGDGSEQVIIDEFNKLYSGHYAVVVNYSDFLVLSIFFAIVVTFLVCNELRRRTMQNTALADFTRGEVYFAKLLTTFAAVTIIVLVSMIVYVGTTVIALGWGKAFTAKSLFGDMFLFLVLGLLISYGLTAMLSFFGYLLKNPIFVFLIGIGIPLVLGTISTLALFGFEFFEFLQRFSFTNVLVAYFSDRSLTNLAYCIVVIVALIVPFTLGGYFVFKKQEIK